MSYHGPNIASTTAVRHHASTARQTWRWHMAIESIRKHHGDRQPPAYTAARCRALVMQALESLHARGGRYALGADALHLAITTSIALGDEVPEHDARQLWGTALEMISNAIGSDEVSALWRAFCTMQFPTVDLAAAAAQLEFIEENNSDRARALTLQWLRAPRRRHHHQGKR